MNRSRRSGLTLIEVLLTMAIVAMVLTALIQLQDSGARAATRATLVAEACVLCQSELDAWLAGSYPNTALDSVEALPGTDLFSRRFSLQPLPTQPGLSLLTVEVFRGQHRRPEFTLTRWITTQMHGEIP